MKRPTSTDAIRLLEPAIAPLGRALRGRRVGPAGSLSRQRGLDVPATISLTSPAFADGTEIPDRFCGPGIGENISPALDWSGVPDGTVRLLLALEDLDAPSATHTAIHAAAVLTARGREGGLAEGALARRNARLAWVRSRRGPRGYLGPRPLPGHGTHTYVFHLFAIDTPITPPRDADLPTLVRMLRGRVTARGELTGTRSA